MSSTHLGKFNTYYRISRTILIKFGMIGVVLLMISCVQTRNTIGKTGELSEPNPSEAIDITIFGAVGDGVTDDTIAIQQALTKCSRSNLVCKIPKAKNFLIRSPIFVWGEAQVIGEDGTGTLIFDIPGAPYLFNVGISAPQRLESPFSGRISNVRFIVTSKGIGRIIYFWRTKNATISDNTFEVGENAYSATSSGNDNNWVLNSVQNCVRKNISILRNKIFANGKNLGSEGIGIGSFDGVLIENNEIIGVGDDPIAIHFSSNVKITKNQMKSVDGRLIVVNSKNVEIAYNNVERMRALQDGQFHKGISLLYIGFEDVSTSNNYAAPTNTHVHNNNLYYPPGAIDSGAALYLYGPRNAIVESNTVTVDSALVTGTGLHLLPRRFSINWSDPDHLDPSHVARVGDVTISGNIIEGKYPLPIVMTGNCTEYNGRVKVHSNSASKFQFYCDQVTFRDNVIIK